MTSLPVCDGRQKEEHPDVDKNDEEDVEDELSKD